jgi:cytochrome c556
MKAVGAANGAMRGAARSRTPRRGGRAAKMVALFKDAQQFWTARNNAEAAEWSGAAMKQAETLSKATDINAAMGAMKELGGSCMTCHTKYREKTETGFAIKKS